MNFAQLRAVVTVVDEGGFTPAAAVLGLTQSAVSHAVASLERELRLQLLSRARGGVGLTAHGERIIAHAREVVRRVDRISQDAAAIRGQHAGRLRLAGFPSAAQLLPALVAQFYRRFPDVSVVLLEGTDTEVRNWLEDRLVDVGVVAELDSPTAGHSPTATSAVLATDRMVAVLDHDHPLAAQRSVNLAELSDDPFLLSDGGCEPLLRQMHEAAGLTLAPARRIRDMATLLALVGEGLGVSVIPELAVSSADRTVCIPVTPQAHRVLHLVPADPSDVSATVQALLLIAGQAHATTLQGRTHRPLTGRPPGEARIRNPSR